LEQLAALHGQHEAEDDYADGRRYLDFQHFDLEGWIVSATAAQTERTFGNIVADNPEAARTIYRAAFTAAYRATVQRLEQQWA